MMTIHKQILFKCDDVPGHVNMEFPFGSRNLSIQKQDNAVCIWYECYVPERKVERFTFYIHATGSEIKHKQFIKYLTTVQDPPFVWHIYIETYPRPLMK